MNTKGSLNQVRRRAVKHSILICENDSLSRAKAAGEQIENVILRLKQAYRLLENKQNKGVRRISLK
jgi:hypothetical protein